MSTLTVSRPETAPVDAGMAPDALIETLAHRARAAEQRLGRTSGEQRDAGLRAAAARLRADAATILAANAEDVAEAKAAGLAPAMIDRLALDEARLDAMARGLETVAALPDPLGAHEPGWVRPNGLRIQRVRVPLGVVGIVYESRPNVTADAGGLCIKAGNAAILRGGSESFRTSGCIVDAIRAGLAEADLPEDAVQRVPTRDREAVGAMLRGRGLIDVMVPRGGKSLIERVLAEARMPVIGHLEGLCHVYLHRDADPAKARAIALNAKMRRTGICGAAETLLIDREVATILLPPILEDLHAAGCEVRGDEAVCAIDGAVLPASETDWETEYLDAILAIRVVDDPDAALAHIARYGSGHTDAIVTEDAATAERFLVEVDSAIVMVNASTQFADGGEFGMGAEIGISTDKFHARGPVGADQLTSYKYVVHGDGQTRP